MALGKKRSIIKHSSAIQTSGEASLLERKTWNVLLLNAYDDLKDRDVFEISIGELNKALKFNSNDYEMLKEALKVLNRTQVEWNILEKDREVEWEVTTLLAGVKIVNGVCYYSYNPLIKDRLSNPKIYARLSLFEQNLIKGKYSLILWELFKDYIGIGYTGWIPIEDLRKLLGLKEGEYTEFKILNRDIIKRAITELNKVSVIYIDPKNGIEKKREGRNIVALKFIIKANKKNVEKIPKLEAAWNADEKQMPLPFEKVHNRELLRVLTEEFELNEKEAVKFIKSKDEFNIEQNLQFVRFYRDEGKIKESIKGLTIKALNENIQLDSKQKEKAASSKEVDEKNRRKEALEHIKRNVQIKRNEIFKQKEFELSEEELGRLKESFEKYINEGGYGETFKAQFKTQGEKTRLYKGNWYYYLRSKILPPEIEEFRKYAEEKGFDYDKLKAEFES